MYPSALVAMCTMIFRRFVTSIDSVCEEDFSRKGAKGAKRCRVSQRSLCAFAPLREIRS